MSAQDPVLKTMRDVPKGGLSKLLRMAFDGYFGILVVGSGVRVFGLVSQFIVLIMMGRMLAKSEFGDLMTAFGFYRLVAIAIGTGASLVVLYHVARRPQDRTLEVRLHRYSTLLAAIVSTAIALAGVFGAHAIADMLGKPGLAVWFQQLAPFGVFSGLLIISTGALEGRSRITHSILLGELAPNVVRIVLLPLVTLTGLPEIYIAHVLTISVLLPWLYSATRLCDRSIAGVRAWDHWDYSYAGKFVIATLFANQLAAVDILVAGVLFSSETVGDYAIAARIATLFSFFQIAMLKRFAPRAGKLIEGGDMAGLRSEVEVCRRLTIGCGALTISGGLMLAPFLLPLFGNYAGALVFLTWLAIPTFVQSFYATSDRLLIIAGHANVALILTASSFCVLTTTPFVTAHWLGPISVPAAMIASALLFNSIVAVRTRQFFGIRTIEPLDRALMACGTLALAVSALNPSPFFIASACAVLGLIGLYLIGSAMRQPRGAPSVEPLAH